MDFFSGNIDPRQAAQYLRDPTRLAGVLQQQAPGWNASPAEILADVVNVERADTKAIADAVGADVENELMSEDRAAELIAGITDGDAVEVIQVFNELARQRDLILKELLDEDEYDEFMRQKTSVMYTDDPDTWDDEDDVDDVQESEDVQELQEPEGSDQDDVAAAVDEVDQELGVQELRENVEAGTIEDTEWVREAIDETDDVDLLREAAKIASPDLREFIFENADVDVQEEDDGGE